MAPTTSCPRGSLCWVQFGARRTETTHRFRLSRSPDLRHLAPRSLPSAVLAQGLGAPWVGPDYSARCLLSGERAPVGEVALNLPDEKSPGILDVQGMVGADDAQRPRQAQGSRALYGLTGTSSLARSTNNVSRSRHLPKIIRMAALVLLVFALVVIGCGSSPRTTPADVHAIAVAEHRFLAKYGRANQLGRKKCSGRTGAADTRCYQAVVLRRQSKAAAEFLKFREALLDAGVGPKCAKALEETEAVINSLPEFPGEALMACRSESRQ